MWATLSFVYKIWDLLKDLGEFFIFFGRKFAKYKIEIADFAP